MLDIKPKTPQSATLKFFSRYPSRKYSRGQIILHQDEVPSDVFYIESGRIKQYILTDNNSEIMLNIFRSHTFFPVYLALTNTSSEHIYCAMTKIEIRKVPVDEFKEFFINSPRSVLEHLEETYIRSNKAMKRMAYMAASSAYRRVLFELVNECSFLKPKKDGSYQIKLRAYEIAECAGLSRETTSRVLQKLKRQKLVKVTRRFIAIRNLEGIKLELESQS